MSKKMILETVLLVVSVLLTNAQKKDEQNNEQK